MFGPVMGLWFLTIAALGLKGISEHPSILAAVNPLWDAALPRGRGIHELPCAGRGILKRHGSGGPLCPTWGTLVPVIRIGWYAVVFPSLILNYAGQGATFSPPAGMHKPVLQLCPAYLVLPLTGLATLATIIASQSIITGAFSMTRQAIRLGWMPHMRITVTVLRGRLRPDLCERRELAADDRDDRPHDRVQEVHELALSG